KSIVDDDVLAFNPPELTEPLPERLNWRRGGRAGRENAYSVDFARRLRPGGQRRGEEGGSTSKERAAVHHSITWSARSKSDGGMVRPSALEVLSWKTTRNFG